jgi:hypothetical protein
LNHSLLTGDVKVTNCSNVLTYGGWKMNEISRRGSR